MPSVTIVGPGRVGLALAGAIASTQFELEHLIGRRADPQNRVETPESLTSIGSDVILITVSDDAIESVARMLASCVTPGTIALHCSGALSSEVLDALAAVGCNTGSMHPLISVTAQTEPTVFRNAAFCVEGDETAVSTADALIEALGGYSFTIKTEAKTIYHAAAVAASGHLTALLELSFSMMGKAGVDDPMLILRPLVERTIRNIWEKGTVNALTGPFARGDISILRREIDHLECDLSRNEFAVFLGLAALSLELAARGGLAKERGRGMLDLIEMAKRSSGL
ncbi:MAG: DUF2520 domain-containing protein [Pyrinomonadaceae bacterium]|nr:DUF2520 domain-containing protein [Pyrinomonadaceae bacterium]